MVSLNGRIGAAVVDLRVEEAIDFAHENGFRYIETELSRAGNDYASFDRQRIEGIRARTERTGVGIGLHTLSAVNMAEFSPHLNDGVDQYIRSYIDLAGPLGAEFVIVHAGYHFTKDRRRRMASGLERLHRMGDYARKKGVKLYLENMNPEPEFAEVKYLAHNIEETKFYFDQLDPEAFSWSFTTMHAHILPCGIAGFFEAFKSLVPGRLGQVRIADNGGLREEHLVCGEGTIDFPKMFQMIEDAGYTGHYMLCLVELRDVIRSKDYLLRLMGDRAPVNA